MFIPAPLFLKRKYIKRFLKAEALDRASAKTLVEIGVKNNLVLKSLIAARQVRKVDGDKFYFDYEA